MNRFIVDASRCIYPIVQTTKIWREFSYIYIVEEEVIQPSPRSHSVASS